jgi:hypothetical protein
MNEGADRTFKGWVRPLSLSSIRIRPFDKAADKIDPELLLRDFCCDWSSDTVEQIKARYTRIDTAELDIFIVPAENVVLEKLVWPLRRAKIAFSVSDFLACIASVEWSVRWLLYSFLI